LEGSDRLIRRQGEAYLRDGCEIIFTEINHVRNFAMEIASDFNVRPRVAWNSDASVLTYEARDLSMAVFRSWIAKVQSRAVQQLQVILHVGSEWLATERNPIAFIDHLVWKNQGGSIRDFEANGLHKGSWL
jgi:hypothetical protein